MTFKAIILGIFVIVAPTEAFGAPLCRATLQDPRASEIAMIFDRIRWLKNRPQIQIENSQTGSIASLGYSGLAPGTEVLILPQDTAFYHYTSEPSSREILTSDKMFGGLRSYIRAVNAGTEKLYLEYFDMTGVFFVDHILSPDELGHTGAKRFDALLRVIIPAGTPIIRLPSRKKEIPFFLIPLKPGDGVNVKSSLS